MARSVRCGVLAVVLATVAVPPGRANAAAEEVGGDRGSSLAGCWQQFAAPPMMDVEIGANGAIWGMGANDGNGWPVYQYTGSSWVNTGRYGHTVAVSPTGQPWYLDLQGSIFRLTAGGWSRCRARRRRSTSVRTVRSG
ncbi:hypothetical protein ACN27G_17760 [Plantactinospora sp. WMMB334]|uniref:hypothetical protein n=1 Tax=Plantactinospora sp. WMMB334 TaxID=3404119 RepID=UPI003B93E5D4